MFQDQQEIPGQRHFFERLKSVDNNIDAIKLTELVPTETLLPLLVHETGAEDRAVKKSLRIRILTTTVSIPICAVLLNRYAPFLFVPFAVLTTLGIIISTVSYAPVTRRVLMVVAILNNRLSERRETRYCVAVIRLLGTTGTTYGDTPTLRNWLFATLPFLTESEAQALPEEARVVLRRWLTAYGTTDAERVVLLLVLASANDTKARELARRYKNAASEAVREAARELLS